MQRYSAIAVFRLSCATYATADLRECKFNTELQARTGSQGDS